MAAVKHRQVPGRDRRARVAIAVWEGGSVRVDASRAAGPALAGLLTVAGVAHFMVPAFYDPVIPRALPGSARTWVLASGAAELACAATVANKRTRTFGASLAAVLFVVIFPANIKMALDWSHQGAVKAAVGWIRLPLQLPLVWWALRVRRMSAARQIR
jgi:uncharacterized membrane protein